MKYISAPCGSGKTYVLVGHAIELAKRWGETVIVAQPTKELVKKTIETEVEPRWRKARYKEFHGDSVTPGRVVAELMRYLKKPDDRGEMIFITQQSLSLLPYVPAGLHLLIDETPQVTAFNDLRLPHNHALITDLVVVEPYNATYSRLVASDKDSLKKIAANPDGDEVYEKLRTVAGLLANRHYESFVRTTQYKRLLDGTAKKLTVFSTLNRTVIDRFSSVVMAGANLEQSLAYRLWKLQGLRTDRDDALQAKLRFQQHQNGQLVTIRYCDDFPWSRKRSTKTVSGDILDQTTIRDRIIANISDRFGDRPFLWQGNVHLTASPFGSNGIRLPNAPHGLNSYCHIDNLAFLSSLNPNPEHFRFLEAMGLSGDEVREAIYYATAYQSIMRTSIRDPENTSPKEIIVPDRGVADFLGLKFPGATIIKDDIGLPDQGMRRKVGRRRFHASDRDRRAAYRKRMRVKLLDDLFNLSKGNYRHADRVVDEKAIEIITHFVPDPSLTYSLYKSKFSGTPLGYFKCATPEDSISWLKSLHGRTCSEKDKGGLVSPAIFDPNHPNRVADQDRGLGNIIQITQVWMDFENGDLKPETIAEIFPYYRLVITNSYNHTKEKPRFRVILPLAEPVTIEVHGLIYQDLIHAIEVAGYLVRKPPKGSSNFRQSGLDTSKIPPTSLFYAPCQAAVQADSFFDDYDDPDRNYLNPIDIVNNGVWFSSPDAGSEIRTTKQQTDHGPINQGLVEAATKDWRQSKHHPGEGRHRFFMYGYQLTRAGMKEAEISERLLVEGVHGRSPQEREKQVPDILTSLRKYGRLD